MSEVTLGLRTNKLPVLSDTAGLRTNQQLHRVLSPTAGQSNTGALLWPVQCAITAVLDLLLGQQVAVCIRLLCREAALYHPALPPVVQARDEVFWDGNC